MRKTGLMLAAAAALSIAAPANAVVTLYTIGGTGTGTLGLDLTGGVYSLNSFNYSLAGMTFDTSNSGLFLGNPTTLIIGGNALGPTTLTSSQNDFWLWMNPTLGSQTAALLQYGFTGNTQGIIDGTATLTVTTAPQVPEPATWAMMLIGFAGIGSVLRRRRVAALA